MAIVVEDGSNVEDANSFVSLEDYKTYATDRGYTIPNDDAVTEQFIIRSTDYFQTLDNSFKGQHTYDDQSLPYPRCGAYISTRRNNAGCLTPFPDNEIPKQLIAAQCEAINFLVGGGDFMPTTTGAFVTVEKVDVIETHYSEKFGSFNTPNVPIVDAMLAPLLDEGFDRVRSVRI